MASVALYGRRWQMAISSRRPPAVLGFAMAIQLTAWPAFAECGNGSEMTGNASLATIVQPGDAVTVTPWSGRKQTGQVTAVTDCLLLLRTAKALDRHALCVNQDRQASSGPVDNRWRRSVTERREPVPGPLLYARRAGFRRCRRRDPGFRPSRSPAKGYLSREKATGRAQSVATLACVLAEADRHRHQHGSARIRDVRPAS